MKASDAIARFLSAHDVDTCFELVGGMIAHLLDSMAESKRFNIISMHHEQAAAFAAEGFARRNCGKRLAIAMGTSGPGATNLVTGIGSCWFDSVPCLFITGQVNTSELKGSSGIRQQGFQELDVVAIVQSITKFAARVEHADQILPQLHRALSLALGGRKGPVLIDIPNDLQRVQISDADVLEWSNKPLAPDPLDTHPVPESELSELGAACRKSRRPLICVGGGARWTDAINQGWLGGAESHGVPYVSTLMGHERLPAGPHYFNMIGAYGNREANWAIQNCDLLIAIGARLDVRQTGADTEDFARNAFVVQIDIDAAQLRNRIKASLNICASAEVFLEQFTIGGETFPNIDADWIVDLTKKKALSQIDEYADWKISPSRVFTLLNRALQDHAVDYVCDVGNHQMWAAQGIRLGKHQAVHYSGGMGAMGFALPAAIGVALRSSRKTLVITGDGSLQVNSQELDTLGRLGLDITIIVMNNGSLGMVKNFQDMYFDGRDQSTRKGYSCPSFVRLAEAYGIEACRIDDHAELEAALMRLNDRKTPLLLELMMEGATECRPRLAFGRKLDEQLPIPG